MKRSWLVICLVLVVVLAAAIGEWARRAAVWNAVAERESYNTRDGKKEAEADIARGEVKWKVLGSGWSEEGWAHLKRLGIKADHFYGSGVSDGILRYRYTYNSTVYAHFMKLVGKELTEEVLGDPPIDPSAQYEKG